MESHTAEIKVITWLLLPRCIHDVGMCACFNKHFVLVVFKFSLNDISSACHLQQQQQCYVTYSKESRHNSYVV